MKKLYVTPQVEASFMLPESLMNFVIASGTAPGEDADAPARREFTPQFDHGNLI
ncbi:MAG: hypothetical protein IJ621_03880 [Paludibacteraceae bacterium]|nr:hypothetical protein [Paludibacteraceae bacterium]